MLVSVSTLSRKGYWTEYAIDSGAEMTSIFALLLLTTQAVPSKSTPRCEPQPLVTIIGARPIYATASKDGHPLMFATVSLYSHGMMIGGAGVMTDSEGRFVLDPPSWGISQLVITGLGRFDIEVSPEGINQRGSYWFGEINGCPTVMITFN
jgi:hypothetical protein